MPAAGDKFDLYREALVVEHDALWSEEAARLGAELGRRLLDAGAEAILEAVYGAG